MMHACLPFINVRLRASTVIVTLICGRSKGPIFQISPVQAIVGDVGLATLEPLNVDLAIAYIKIFGMVISLPLQRHKV